MNIKPANGTTGHLITNEFGCYFRVYDYTVLPPTFIDYDIYHSDLLVTIIDTDSAFYSKPQSLIQPFLDHCPETLGEINA